MAEKRKNGPHGPGGPGPRDFRKPKNAGRTISTLLGYVGKSKWLLGVVAVCLVLNVGCSIGGSYMLRPLINDCIIPGDYPRLARMLAVLAGIYVCAALLSYTYARIMVHVSQRTTHAIRQDLFAKMQRLPLSYFDTHTHGELMSRYTNDIETITEILNNGMISLISGGLTFIGVVAMMLYLSPALFLVSVFSMGLMMVVVMTVGRRSRRYFSAQQRDLGVINGYIEEMIEGQKVIKVFTHERAAKAGFDVRNEAYRRSAVNALRRRYDARHGQHQPHQLRPDLLRRRAAVHRLRAGPGVPGGLSPVYPAVQPAHQSDEPAGQQPSRRHCGRGAGL